MRKAAVALAGLLATAMAPEMVAGQAAPPAWLYPPFVRPAPGPVEPRHVPNSTATYDTAQIANLFGVPDWRPAEHPPMPPSVGEGRKPDVAACGFCHYPNGEGRPENAALAGLPAAYIVDQMQAFASGQRKSASSGATTGPGGNGGRGQMTVFAKAATPAEIQSAADYFSKLTYHPQIKVVESDDAPAIAFEAGFPMAVAGKPREPLAGRIVELSDAQDRAAIRDSDVGYTALAPKGSLARGEALAATGGPAGLPCAACHGVGLRGGPGAIAPPIAGRSPTYIARALYDFHEGMRDAPSAQLMKPVAAKLELADMVALAAYVGSLKPQ